MSLWECILPAVAWVPALATDEVASIAPSHRVLGALTHGVNSRTAAVRPPGVEVPVVGTLAVGSVLAPLKGSSCVAIVTLGEEVEGGSQGPSDRKGGEKKRLEGDHNELEKRLLFEVLIYEDAEALCFYIDCLAS